MTRKAVLAGSLAAMAALAAVLAFRTERATEGRPPAAQAAAAAHPDVLILIASGLGAEPGLPPLRNLERLAARGRRFERAYAQYPAPGASRTSVFTGWRPERTGVWWAPGERVEGATPLEERFAAAGYVAIRVGPVYAGPGEAQFRWSRVVEAPSQGSAARRAGQVLAEPRDGPLFLAVNLGPAPDSSPPPPGPAILPTIPRSRAAAGDLPALAYGPVDALARPGVVARPSLLPPGEPPRRAAARTARAAAIDAQLGALLDVLDRRGAWERTVVVLTGDVGVDGGSHGALPRPDTLFEDALHVPLVVAAPGMSSPGSPATGLAELVDLYPTVVRLAGLPEVPGLDGADLQPMLDDPAAGGREAVYSAVAREAGQIGRSARTTRYRYTEWPDGSEELYDHQSDPGEFTNLAGRGALGTVVADMRRLLASRYRAAEGPASAAAPPASRPAKPRNVLLVVFDDLNARIGPYGAPVQTPNIERLAQRGRLFTQAYAQVAMCSPSRSSLMSGWRPERTDIWNNLTPVRQHLQGATPLQEYFHARGYYTARVGKIYEGAMSDQFDWDDDDERTAPDEGGRRDDDVVRGAWWVATGNADEDEPDGARARQAARLIAAHRDRPFFIAVGFAKPHLKWVAPKKYFDLYPPDMIRWPEEPKDDLADIPAIAIKNRPQERPGVPLAGREPPGMVDDPKFRREATAAYSATVTFVDAQLGVLLDALDRERLWDDTVVVLVGDHGFHLGEHHGLWRKDTLFEEGVRAPLVIAAPGVGRPGAAAAAPVEFLDVYPTVVDLAGLPVPPGLDGSSLRPVLADPSREIRPAALSFRKAKAPLLGVSVRTDRYRYTQWPDGSEELYDHAHDPAEIRNLARSPAAAGALETMRRLRAAAPVPAS